MMMVTDTQHKQKIATELAKSLKLSSDIYMESIIFLLKERKELFADIENNYRKINTLTSCVLVMFFSYTENTAILIKHILKKADDSIQLNFSSKKQKLICKNDSDLSFEDTMAITFSALPSLFGESGYYGIAKSQHLKNLSVMRDMRNSIIHPKGIEDVFISLEKLKGEDINAPIISYIEAMKDVINICARNSSNLK